MARCVFEIDKKFYFSSIKYDGFYKVSFPEGEAEVLIDFSAGRIPLEIGRSGKRKGIAAAVVKAIDFYRANFSTVDRTPGKEELFFSELRDAFWRSMVYLPKPFDITKSD